MTISCDVFETDAAARAPTRLLPLKRKLNAVCQAALRALNKFVIFRPGFGGLCCVSATAADPPEEGSVRAESRIPDPVRPGFSAILLHPRNTLLEPRTILHASMTYKPP